MGSMQGFTRLFTVEEANALIPGLRPVVEELLGTFREIRAEVEEAAGQDKLSLGRPELGKHLEERAVAPRLIDKIKRLSKQNHSHRCQVNGRTAVLISISY